MKELNDLLTDEVEARYGLIQNVQALHDALDGAPEVIAIRRALASEVLSLGDVSFFVDAMMRDLKSGVRFEHDSALCAVAISLEGVSGAFADEFLHDLSMVRAGELRRASRLAALSSARRSRLANNVEKVVRLTPPNRRPMAFAPQLANATT